MFRQFLPSSSLRHVYKTIVAGASYAVFEEQSRDLTNLSLGAKNDSARVKEKYAPKLEHSSAIIKQAFADAGVRQVPHILYQEELVPFVLGIMPTRTKEHTLGQASQAGAMEWLLNQSKYYIEHENPKEFISQTGEKQSYWHLYSKNMAGNVNKLYVSFKIDDKPYQGELIPELITALRENLWAKTAGTAPMAYSSVFSQPTLTMPVRYAYLPPDVLYAIAGEEAIRCKHMHSSIFSFINGASIYVGVAIANMSPAASFFAVSALATALYNTSWKKWTDKDAYESSAEKLGTANDLIEHLQSATVEQSKIEVNFTINETPIQVIAKGSGNTEIPKQIEHLGRFANSKTSLFHQSPIALEVAKLSEHKIVCEFSATKPKNF